MTEDDDAWSPDRRETLDDVKRRIVAFLQDLAQREETNIVVISHGVWIECCLNMLCPEALDNGQTRVHNCNVFVGDCVCNDGKFVRLQNIQRIH